MQLRSHGLRPAIAGWPGPAWRRTRLARRQDGASVCRAVHQLRFDHRWQLGQRTGDPVHVPRKRLPQQRAETSIISPEIDRRNVEGVEDVAADAALDLRTTRRDAQDLQGVTLERGRRDLRRRNR